MLPSPSFLLENFRDKFETIWFVVASSIYITRVKKNKKNTQFFDKTFREKTND